VLTGRHIFRDALSVLGNSSSREPALNQKFIEANGLRFAYLEEGRGPLVLLLHGFPDTPHTWDLVRPALAKQGWRAVSPFMRGYVPSEIPTVEAFDSDTLGRDVLALIEALGESRAVVIGHDWGADAAYAAAILGPDHVRQLVTLAIPHPASLRPTPRMLWAGRHFFSLRRSNAAAMVRRNNFAHIDELVRRWSPTWDFGPDENAEVKAVFGHPGSLEAALGYYRALRPAKKRLVKVPTVSFAGEDDTLDANEFERARPLFTAGYKVISMPGGHFMHREHPEIFEVDLLKVMKTLNTSSVR
jgi:pimeloyl-ACP methyl ester carboxylesterase